LSKPWSKQVSKLHPPNNWTNTHGIVQMKTDRWLKTGLWGSIVTAICCVTPILPFLLGLIGLAAFTSYLDYVLFPLLGLFLILTFYAWLKQKKSC
jgi:mercuric ion transport protein